MILVAVLSHSVTLIPWFRCRRIGNLACPKKDWICWRRTKVGLKGFQFLGQGSQGKKNLHADLLTPDHVKSNSKFRGLFFLEFI